MTLRSEIYEQPEALARLLGSQWGVAESIARAVRERDVAGIFLAARGSSDNAGLYAKYMWGAYGHLPIALAAPSLFTLYGRPPAIARMLVVGISQSGQSPDIVGVVRAGRDQGALTLAITNEADSPLAEAAELVLDTRAGPERAIAASKSYTTQLVAIAMIAAALAGNEEMRRALGEAPELAAEALALDAAIAAAAPRWRELSECVVLGRGFNYATAYEWALKLKELAQVFAEPYSSADFLHGPAAMLSEGFPVLAVVPGGAAFADVFSLLSRLVRERGARAVAISDRVGALALAELPIRLPRPVPEWLSPLPAIVAAQLLCYHLTLAKGLDPEAPRGLEKVTRTW